MARTKVAAAAQSVACDTSNIPRIAARKSPPPSMRSPPPLPRSIVDVQQEIECIRAKRKLKKRQTNTNTRAKTIGTKGHAKTNPFIAFTHVDGYLVKEAQSPQQLELHKRLLSEIALGHVVEVYWPGEGEYFRGRVVSVSPKIKGKFQIRYDDGDLYWEHLYQTPFNIVYNRTDVGEIEEVLWDMENENVLHDAQQSSSDDDNYTPH